MAPQAQHAVSPAPSKGAVLSKAVVKAAQRLGISQTKVAETLGVSGPTASRLFAGKYTLEPERRKEWELAALFVRVFRSLDSIVASEERARAWLNSGNRALGGPPDRPDHERGGIDPCPPVPGRLAR